MKEALDKIRGAISSKGLGANLDHYVFLPGEILATDGRMTARTPYPHDISCAIPGPDLDALASRLASDISMSLSEPGLLLKSGRLRGTIAAQPADSVGVARPQGTWQPPPANLIQALRLARPFIAETSIKAWGLCACLTEDAILATNNMAVVRVACPGLKPPKPLLLPAWAVDFLIKADALLDGIQLNEGSADFHWLDDTWMHTQLVNDEMPAAVGQMTHDIKATVELPKEWLRAYAPVGELAESLISISSDKITGSKLLSKVEAEIETEGLNGVLLHFNPKFLGPVLAVATHWEPSTYPRLAWRGDGIVGLVIGRQA